MSKGRLAQGALTGLAFVLEIAVAIPAGAAENVRDVLRRQTQEMLDAVGAGTTAVWERYLDPGVRYTDESGGVSTKKQMVAQIRPLPAGVTGTIKVKDFDAVVHGDVAVTTYVADEHERYHGHALHCQYRATETWRRTGDGWRLIAAQVLALRTDPPALALPASVRSEYCGTYALTPKISYEIRCKGSALEGQETGRPARPLKAEARDVLFVPGRPRYRYVFLRDANGKITGFAERREAWDLVWKRK